jgi:hypothetical protein
MVLFFGTAVAMKRQDEHGIAKGVAEGLEDLFNPDNEEEMLFSGQVYHLQRQTTCWHQTSEITDTKYLHAFRVFRDEASGCVRFEASARRGPRKSIPIWTAFVTQYIGHKSWMKPIGPATIQFRELHPYIFNEVYRLPKGRSNKYQLTFSKQEGKSLWQQKDNRDADHPQMRGPWWIFFTEFVPFADSDRAHRLYEIHADRKESLYMTELRCTTWWQKDIIMTRWVTTIRWGWFLLLHDIPLSASFPRHADCQILSWLDAR